MALTFVSIKNSKARTKAYKLSDSGGLFLLVTPAGAKYWRWIPKHAKRVLNSLERDVFPAIGYRPIAEITPSEISAVVQRVEDHDAVINQAGEHKGKAFFLLASWPIKSPMTPSIFTDFLSMAAIIARLWRPSVK